MGTKTMLMDSPTNGQISLVKDERAVVWSKAARIAASTFNKNERTKILNIVNRFNLKNGLNQDLSVIYALPFNKVFKIMIQPRFNQLEVLDIVNNQNYDPAKVLEVTL